MATPREPRIARVISVQGRTVTLSCAGQRWAVVTTQPVEAGDWVDCSDADALEIVQRPTRPLRAADDWSRMNGDGARRMWALRERAVVLEQIRAVLRARGLLEVETPAMARCPGLELHLDAVGVDLREGMGGALTRRWLVTSPEFHMKRLLSAGSGPIFQIAKAFRSGERGHWHNPEFTMLEWYRDGQDYRALLDDFVALLTRCSEALGELRQAHGRPGDVRRPPPLLLVSFAEALQRWAKVDVAQQSVAQLRQHCREAGFDVRDGDDEATVLTQVLVEGVEPRLPSEQLIAIDRWAASLASLAQRRPDEPTLADRFEVYWGATELANGFNELVDPAEQRARFRDDLSARAAMGRPEYPIDERFISALEAGCPPSAGVAVGVDRVLMVLGGYDDIDDVLAFPFERA